MLFNSYVFILVFVPIVFFSYFYFTKKGLTDLAKSWLVFASLFFYSWWNPVYLPLILASILFNYAISSSIVGFSDTKSGFVTKKHLLIVGLVFNIGLLVYFKYMDFFINNINYIAGTDLTLLHLALPLGISFYTLQQIAFLIDCYEGLVKERKFLDYTIFVSFFPQLIAGPIVHHKEVMPQFAAKENKHINYNNITAGLFLFSIGLFKKVIIADSLSQYTKRGFDQLDSLNMIEAWSTSLAYTFQLYFDFSGYSDMAIGVALLFNIKLPQNFNSPLRATGVIDYWRRWHITLTNFLTSYVYTPIVRSFSGVTFEKAMIATIIVFLISGIWHGAGWTFVIYGLLHGMAVVTNHYWQKKIKIKLPMLIAWFVTFMFVNIANIFFRAKNFDDALKVLGSMFDIHNLVLPEKLKGVFGLLSDFGVRFGEWNHVGGSHVILWIVFSFIVVFVFQNSIHHLNNFKINYRTSVWAASLFIISLLSMDKVSEFIYFNF